MPTRLEELIQVHGTVVWLTVRMFWGGLEGRVRGEGFNGIIGIIGKYPVALRVAGFTRACANQTMAGWFVEYPN